jgi:hypothetical protein
MKRLIFVVTLLAAGISAMAQSVQTQILVAPPQGVFMQSYDLSDKYTDGSPEAPLLDDSYFETLNWANGSAGFGTYTSGPMDLGLSETNMAYNEFFWPAVFWPQWENSGVTFWGKINNAAWTIQTNSANTGPGTATEHCDASEAWTGVSFYGPYTVSETRTADAEIKLATGGPLGSKAVRLWVISAGATGYTNLWDPVGFPIPSEKISIGGLGNLDAMGDLFALLPDNDPDDVTPTVPGVSILKFSKPSATPYTPVIVANGVTLDPNSVTNGADFCVGQAVQFSIAGMPTHFIGDDVAMWSLGGTFVNTNSDPNCNLYYTENPAFLTRHYATDKTTSTSCWYVLDALPGTVSVTLYYRNYDNSTYGVGPLHSITITGKFNVHRPAANFIPPSSFDGTPTVMIANYALALGNGRDRDMSFGHQINPGNFSGQAGYTQLISGNYTLSSSGLPLNIAPNSGLGTPDTELDNGEFPRGQPSIPVNANSMVVFWDGPADRLHQGNAEENVVFSTYLMFKPSGGIWVPLRLVSWSLNDGAANGSIVSGQVLGPTDGDCSNFPDWKIVFSNLPF